MKVTVSGRRLRSTFRLSALWGLRRRRKVRAALSPETGLRMPVGGLFLTGEAQRWRRVAGFAVLEVRYLHAGGLVAELMVTDKSTRHSRELVAERLEVVPAWRGRGVGGFLTDLLTVVSANDWDLMSGVCDSDGRLRWLGLFDWDVRGDHLAANVAALAATLTGNKWIMTNEDAGDVQEFLDQLNATAGLAPDGWRVRPDRTGTVFHHPRIGMDDAALIVLNSVDTSQLFAMAQHAGAGALRMLRQGSEWHGLRQLAARS